MRAEFGQDKESQTFVAIRRIILRLQHSELGTGLRRTQHYV